MSNQLEPTNNNPAPAPILAGGMSLVEHANNMDAAHRLAQALCKTSMVPKQYIGKPDDGAAAILYGAELGLNPIQSLQQVMVINGKPGLEARTMVALLKARGYRFTTVESSDTTVTVQADSPRGESEQSTWTLERAKKAGYVTNKLYQSNPQAMLYAKAAAEVCRRIAPDALLGMPYSVEEMRLDNIGAPTSKPAVTVTKKPQSALAAAKKQAPTTPPFADLIQATTTLPELEAVMDKVMAHYTKPDDPNRVELTDLANEKWDEIKSEVAE